MSRRAKYQVFVSSTYVDLHVERQAVEWEILKARHIPAGMETFPAGDDRGWEIIQRTIDDSDFYLVLVAGRYGSVDPMTKISWTEREYDYARSKGLPVLGYIRDPNATASSHTDTGKSAKKLDAFKAKLRKSHLCKTWRQADDLRSEVAASIVRALQDAEDTGVVRPGWIRGDSVPTDALAELTRLSKENSDLRERRVTQFAFDDIEALARGADTIKLEVEFRFSNGTHAYSHPNRSRTVSRQYSITWDEIFGAFAPNLMPAGTEAQVKRDIGKMLKETRGRLVAAPGKGFKLTSAAVSDPDFQTMKVQFIALGLVDVRVDTIAKSNGETKQERMCYLTDLGARQLFAVKAIRR